jgi:EAL domain-containing protein (putative c-di-GMP-specific phosphodiesterase class I)/PAS domain-containing protein
MTESTATPRRRLRLGPLLRVLLPSVFTLILIVLLVITMFFTDFDWQWVTFLAGILFASVLSLVSATWKSGWRMARRTAEAAHFKQRLSAEIEQHRGTREQLERELALHQQDRARLTREAEAHQNAARGKLAAEGMLAMLGLHLEEIAFYVDQSRHYRFHTRAFSAWTGLPPERIDGFNFEDALPPRNAELLRPLLLDALAGRANQVELTLARRDGSEQRVTAECFPRRDAANVVSGALVRIKEAGARAAAAAPQTELAAAEAEHGATKLLISDESGNAVYLSSLTEELSGWGNPRERILEAIQHDGFDLYAQDIVALGADASLKTMHELLIRMHDEERHMVPPGTFLPIAERFNMMPDIDRFVVRKAIAARAAAGTAADAAAAVVLCINLARSTIEDRSFPEFVARALEQSKVPGQALCFEIDDGDALACLPEATRCARELKPLGCRLTLDGFGRSGIGFEHVKALPLDFLKIDGSIILQILRVPEALAKVRAIQRVSKVIGMRTIAEMVESDDSMERLRAAGVDYAQGFGIAKPKPFLRGAD